MDPGLDADGARRYFGQPLPSLFPSMFYSQHLRCLMILLALLLPGASRADLSFVVAADICSPVNVGKAIRTIQNFRGSIVNNSDEETIAVSCPIITEIGTVEVLLRVNAQNGLEETAEFRCVMREISSQNEVLQTVTRSGMLEGGLIGTPFFAAMALTTPESRLNLTCLLPPQGSLGLIAYDTFLF